MISVVMPCWIKNEELLQLTYDAIVSIRNSGKVELVIVDNGSPLGGDMLQQEADIYIKNKKNLGYPKAVNQGIKLARGKHICISNNDIKISPNWINVTEFIMKKYPKVGMLHFRMIPYDESFDEETKDIWITGKERWCHGSFFVIRKDALPKGLYDENYGLGGYDDYDLQHRVRHINGWLSAYTNLAQFQHKDSTTLCLLDQEERKTRDNKNREYFKSKFGQYPDVLFGEKYIKQMNVSWKPFP